MSVNDQFKQQGRIPLKPLPYSKKDLAQCNELLIDYDNKKTYHIYIVDQNDRTKLIDLSQIIIDELYPDASVNANNFRVNIEGILNPDTLHNIINFIYKRFIMPENPHGFNYEEDFEKIYKPTTKSVLLKDTDNVIYLPVTSTDNVFGKDGYSLEERLQNLSRVGFSTDCVRATSDYQTSFHFDYPFADYSKAGNYVEVRIGSTYIDKARYQIIDDAAIGGQVTGATITFIDEAIRKDRAINFLFIYNCKDSTDDKYQYTYGGMIANKSIPSCKLQKISDSYTVNDSTSVASSKALYNLYNSMLTALANGSDYYIACKDTSTTESSINVSIPKTLTNGMILEVALSTRKASSASININGRAYNIYNLSGSLNQYKLPVNKLIKFMFNNNTIYIIDDFCPTPSRYIYTCDDQEQTISYSNLDYTIDNNIFVYRNGVKLFEDLDYSIDSSNQTISLFVRTELGERIVFEAV